VFLSIALFVFGGSSDATPETPAESARGRVRHAVTALLLLGWTGLYAATLDWLGFFLATVVFLLGSFLLLGERRRWVIAATTLGTAGTLYLLLHFGLGLYLPRGSLWLLLGFANV